jgi:magnesium-transporting ATPase (P-type)
MAMHARKYWSMSGSDVLDDLNSSGKGSDKKEAAERLTHCGVNEIVRRKVRTELLIFLSQFKNPLVIILIGAIERSIQVNFLDIHKPNSDLNVCGICSNCSTVRTERDHQHEG